MPTTTNPEVTAAAIASEARWVESGRHARIDVAAHAFIVVSDSRPDVRYEVRVYCQGDALRGTCTCPAGRHAPHGKAVPCKHVAGVFHRGERERWARWDGQRWVTAGVTATA